MKKILFLISLALYSIGSHAQIVFADYSDPDVCQGDTGDYWLTASSFQCTPGLPILHSTDMVHWQLVNYALRELTPQTHYADVRHGCGVWAPCIRKHENTYYIYWGDPDHGIYMVKTQNPASTWEEPVLVVKGKGMIDPSPLWVDGHTYLVNGWANSRCGFNSVLTVHELTADGTAPLTHPVIVYDGLSEGHHTVEGPKFYYRNGYYYILAPAGGVEQGYQIALRSKNVYGPYESKIVFDKEGIHQGGWVADKFVCFQDRGLYGRILHLLDVEMKDGWPMMRISRQNKPSALTYATPQFAYQWHANYNPYFGFAKAGGCRVYGHHIGAEFVNFWSVPNLYLRKFEGETFCDTLSTTLTANGDGQQMGLIVMGRDYARLSFELSEGKFLVKYITCHDAEMNHAEKVVTLGDIPARQFNAGAKDCYTVSVRFRLTCQKGGLCQMAYSVDGAPFLSVPQIFQAREGKWIGAKYGVFSVAPEGGGRGWIDLTY